MEKKEEWKGENGREKKERMERREEGRRDGEKREKKGWRRKKVEMKQVKEEGC